MYLFAFGRLFQYGANGAETGLGIMPMNETGGRGDIWADYHIQGDDDGGRGWKPARWAGGG